MVKSIQEVTRYLRGEPVPGIQNHTIETPEAVDVADIRVSLASSQAALARKFGLDKTAVQAWEHGRRRLDRTARILLAVIAKEPEVVLRGLGKQAR